MKYKQRITALLSVLIAFPLAAVFAQEASTPPPPQTVEQSTAPETPAASAPASTPAPDVTPTPETPSKKPSRSEKRSSHRGSRNEVVTIGADSIVRAGETADQAVAVFGDTRVDGKVGQAVAVMGSTTINGEVEDQAVAVFGNAYINSHVRGQVVAVGGGVELGPDAHVDGQVVSVGGPIVRAPTSVIGGEVTQVHVFKNMPDFSGLHAWCTRALAYGRPLALGAGLAWAWIIAGTFLVCYLVVSLLFPKIVVRCAETFEQRPGGTFLAMLITAVLFPILGVLLTVTVIGPLVFFIVWFVAFAIGKTSVLAWIGRRIALPLGITHPAPAVLIGGLLLTLSYLVPVLGFILWKLTAMLGLGIAVYTAILAIRRRREERMAQAAAVRAERDAQRAAQRAAYAAAQPAYVAPVMTTGEGGMANFANASLPSDAAAATATLPPTAAPATVPASLLLLSDAPRAGFWTRAAALLIDFVMVAIIAKICHIGMLLLPLFAIYCAAMWALRGTTIGGIVCGLKVVRLDGRPLDWTTGIVRALAGFVSMVPVGLGFFWAAFDDEKQSWHDKIAGTVVVYAPKGQSLI